MLDIMQRQTETIAFLRKFRMWHGKYPTLEELALGLGLKSKSGAADVIADAVALHLDQCAKGAAS